MIEFREFFAATIVLEWLSFSPQNHSHMTRKMTIIQKVNRGQLIPCPHFKMRINPLKKKAIFISKRESIRHFEAKVNHHFEETVHPLFRKDRHQSFRKDRALSFRNDSFASDSTIINLNVSFRNDRESIILK